MTKEQIMLMLGVLFHGTPLIIGIAMGELMNMLLLFAVFAVVNSIAEAIGKKQHAPAAGKIPDVMMCYFTSNALLVLCLLAVRLSGTELLQWQAILLGLMLVLLATASYAKVFHARALDEEYKDLRRKIKSMTKSEVVKLLSAELPDNEYKAIYYVDYEQMGIGAVADIILHCAARTVNNYRKAGYEKLRRLYEPR